MTDRHLLRFLVLFLPVSGCVQASSPHDDSLAVHAAIVGGQKTSGWPAVGALVADIPGYGYMGPFCTGTLIAPTWVLTAAHCISSYQGMPILPFFVKFYLGTDANPSFGGQPISGQLVQAEEFYPHPDYDATLLTVGHDIGLVRLKNAVSGVEPVSLNRRPLRGQHLGSEVLFVGFGVSDGVHQTGSGIKRETTMPMTWFDSGAYYTEPAGSGTCQGDSGGPGFLQMEPGGGWSQIGVVSAGTNNPGIPGDPCLTGMGIYTRVDTHLSWIAGITGLVFPSCADDVCLCDDACRPDGGCEDHVCRKRTCLQSLACLSACTDGEEACQMDCRILTRPEDEVAVDKVAYCMDNKCKGSADLLACVQSRCASSLNECVVRSGTSGDCPTYAACREACPAGLPLCTFACDSGASQEAREAWEAAASCLAKENCPVSVSSLAVQDPCAREHCLTELDGCFPQPPCDPLGGSCFEGTACRILPDQKTRCVASEGRGEGESCDPVALAPCADGLTCVADGSEGICRRACLGDADCRETERCSLSDSNVPGACLPSGPSVEESGPIPDASGSSGEMDQHGDRGPSGLAEGGCAMTSTRSSPLAWFVLLGIARIVMRRRRLPASGA